jgi:hypothetical protein
MAHFRSFFDSHRHFFDYRHCHFFALLMLSIFARLREELQHASYDAGDYRRRMSEIR